MASPCHPEQSEGSLLCNRQLYEILRSAQNDKTGFAKVLYLKKKHRNNSSVFFYFFYDPNDR